MKTVNRVLLVGSILLAVIIAITMPFWPKLAINVFADMHNLSISYEELKMATFKEIVFDHLTVTDRARGIGLSSESATARPIWKGAEALNPALAFNLENVNFIKKALETPPSYNSLDGLVALPFGSNWKYSKISGIVQSVRNGIIVKDFLAKSDRIKFTLNGTIAKDNNISSEITIYFAEELTRKIPPELTKLAFNNEPGGWKSLTVKLDGNFTAPRVQVSSRLFRLNIGVKE